MQFNRANLIILLGLLPILFNLIPRTQINLVAGENSLGYVQKINNLEDKNIFLASHDQNSPKSEVGESRRDKERASGRDKLPSLNNV